MKVVILNKSDSTGGAAVVSRRLLEALTLENIDAQMIVCEKLSDSPKIHLAASPGAVKAQFIKERLKIFIANGLNRSTLFKIDSASDGLPLWRNPFVKDADAILINWVNQGMLSLKGLKKILKLGKPVIWTMHDMWCFTGICHHAGECKHFLHDCGNCKFLKSMKGKHDLSFKIFKKKLKIYNNPELNKRLAFVAVSTWLKEKALQSPLMGNANLEVIPNAFKRVEGVAHQPRFTNKIRLLFGAARLDDPIKGLETLRQTCEILAESGQQFSLTLFGAIKNPHLLDNFPIEIIQAGMVKDEKEVAKLYANSDIVISASSYETLPGTLVEAQAYGCIPVCFNRGGQPDIIHQLATGYMAPYHKDLMQRSRNLARGILWASAIVNDSRKLEGIKEKMKESVDRNFSYPQIARKYINLINTLNLKT